MANEIQRQAEIDPRQRYKQEVDKRVNLLKPLLGDITPEQATALLYQAAASTPDLIQCTSASIVRSIATCIQIGLMPGPRGHIDLLPRRNKGVLECVPQIGYKGYLHLALQSGVTVWAAVVYRGERFRIIGGDELVIEHEIDVENARADSDIIAAYAVATLPDGSKVRDWISAPELEAIRQRAASKSGPWVTDAARMCRKTAIRRLFQGGTVPMSGEMQKALEVDAAADAPQVTVGRAPSALEIAAGITPPPTEIDPLTQFRAELADCPDRDAVYTCRDGWQMDHEHGPLWPDMLAAVHERLAAVGGGS